MAAEEFKDREPEELESCNRLHFVGPAEEFYYEILSNRYSGRARLAADFPSGPPAQSVAYRILAPSLSMPPASHRA